MTVNNKNDELCHEHSGHVARLESLEKTKTDFYRIIEKGENKIDKMKNWVITGMASMILQLFIFIGALILAWLKLSGTL